MQVWGAGKDTANSHKEMMEVFKCCSDLFCFIKDLMSPLFLPPSSPEQSSSSVTEPIQG